MPSIDVGRVRLPAILALREEYRREMNCQIVHDSWHQRGFTRSFLVRLEGTIVGYGSVGGSPGDAKDTVKEFFVRPAARGAAAPLFRKLLAVSGARVIEAQTNDVLLSRMLQDCANDLSSETILFDDGGTTGLAPPPGARLRPVTAADHERVFAHTSEPVGTWGIEYEGVLAGTGGLLFHYNPPYGDIYMEVAPGCRRRGFGSYLVQELKRICYEMDRVPAARCNAANVGSRLTLQRAGMRVCARIVRGDVRV